ncbi:hypothetical protein SASPL_105539 [Salvia splendens]|uniref:Uncharacterized protein n=1 Tax=Salvia splendens TaxID=180675 RepID=A0A8X8YJ74_SALSN|nr:hypothetical protein SASPL_105539 [Salvia splendens]
MATKAALAAALLRRENYQQCRQQVQGRRFHSYQRFLQQRSTNEDEEVLDSYQPSSSLQACCQELKQMDSQQCGWEAIRQAVKQAQQSTRRYQTGQSEQVYEQARALPRDAASASNNATSASSWFEEIDTVNYPCLFPFQIKVMQG